RTILGLCSWPASQQLTPSFKPQPSESNQILMKHQLRRRRFLKASILSSASIGLFSKWGSLSIANAQGSNNDIRAAVVGFSGRGKEHIRGLREVPGVRLVALCDVDQSVLQKEIKECESKGEKIEGYTDIRKLLENPNIDVVSIATPNHWHA